MNPGLIDSHAHLDFEDFDADRDQVVARFRECGVEAVVNVGITLKDSRRSLELAEAHDDIFCSVGVHPHDTAEIPDGTWPEIEAMLDHPKVVAVGETGLDFFRDYAPHEKQRAAFTKQLEIAAAHDLPVIVHSRDAYDECYETIRPYCEKGLRGVMHCYGGTADQARRFADLGLLISFSGTVTFPKADGLRDAVRALKPEEILVETDCPYLAPQPKRGRRNEPAYVLHTAQQVADLHGLSLDDIARITTRNARRLFRLPGAAADPTLAYPIRNSLYINVTYECNIACTFCPREDEPVVKGHDLRLDSDPTLEELKAAIGDPTRYDELVFCGFGEPTLRIDIVRDLARWAKEKGVRTRLNTNGLADEIHGREVLPEIAPFLDAVSVSLNAETAEKFVKICRPVHGEASYQAMLKFLADSVQCIPEVTATVVQLPSVDLKACRQIAENLGAQFRVREYNIVG